MTGRPGRAKRLSDGMRRRPLRRFGVAVLLSLAGLTVFGATRPARHDRDWVAHLSRTPEIALDEDGFSVSPIRDWSYEDGVASENWRENPERFAFGALRRVWFVVEPHPGLGAMAHTLVLFEFPDQQLIGLTIEARRETDEGYSPFWGNWGRYELLYVWASAKDLLTRRAVLLDHEIQIYRLDLTPAQADAFLRRVVDRTRQIADKPRLYNTLFSNCTNELAKAAALDWGPAFIVTGGAARELHRMGVVAPSAAPFEAVRGAAVMTERIRDMNPAPSRAFDARLLNALRDRRGDGGR